MEFFNVSVLSPALLGKKKTKKKVIINNNKKKEKKFGAGV